MDSETNNFIKNVCKEYSRCLVGKLCKQIEIIQDRKDLDADQKLSILKSFNRELVYETFRDLKNSVVYYSEGREYKKLPIYGSNKVK